MDNPLKRLEEFGQSPWYDSISRSMLDSGQLAKLIQEDGLKGVTSNPTIFEKAIAGSKDYDAKISKAAREGVTDPKALFERVAIDDIQDAADLLLPVYEKSQGADGFVSLEVSPTLAYDTKGTADEGRRLFAAVGRKNLMIKVPATREGLPATQQLIGEGVNVNVTLIFSIDRYRQVMDAYLTGLEALAKRGKPLSSVASVASFFVSRIDTSIDKTLEAKPEGKALAGKAAIANAKLAYKAFQDVFASPRFAALKSKGAWAQRPLWASTSTKNPAYRDVIYVEELIGPDTVDTIPPATWDAFRDHGKPRNSLLEGLKEAEKVLADLKKAGIDLDAVTAQLEEAGVKSFAESFETLLRVIREKSGALSASSR